tara:strand:- start:343 stop:1926 length:1584 start_codon:yes stop_codon:yes gene_type:complete
MKIESIRIKNFYSFIDTTLDFNDYKGLTLIKGKNKDAGGSNGSGKSALVEAVFFGLTGKTIRKSTEDALVNVSAKKNCLVEVFLDGGVRILRQKKPTKLQVFVKGEDKTKQNVYDTQEYIDELLNTNYKVLLSSMFFGQSNLLSFLECSADDKRNIIKNFLNLDDIFKMRDRIKTYKSTFSQKIKEQESLVLEHLSLIKDMDGKVSKIHAGKEKFSDYGEEVLSLELSKILDIEEVQTTINWKLIHLERDIDSLRYKVKENKKAKTSRKTHKCSKCGQDVERSIDIKNTQNEVDRFEDDIKTYLEEKKKLQAQIVLPPVSSKEFTKVLEYKELCRDEEKYQEIRDKLSSKIAHSEGIKKDNKLKYEVMRFWEKAFSQQGIIKYIIRNILDYLNDRINYYLSFLTNSQYTLKFNEELLEEVTCNGQLLQYISLSGGEKRKVNLAVTMALKDLLLLTDKNQPDLIFFDEVAENLDEEGIQGLYALLEEIKKDRTVFVITHNKYLKTLLYSATRLSIIKHKGISQIRKNE